MSYPPHPLTRNSSIHSENAAVSIFTVTLFSATLVLHQYMTSWYKLPHCCGADTDPRRGTDSGLGNGGSYSEVFLVWRDTFILAACRKSAPVMCACAVGEWGWWRVQWCWVWRPAAMTREWGWWMSVGGWGERLCTHSSRNTKSNYVF